MPLKNDTNSSLIRSEVRYLLHQEKSPWQVVVNTVGFEKVPDHAAYPQTGHPAQYSFNFDRGRILQEYQMIYVTSGKGLFESSRAEQIVIPEGSVILIRPGEWHRYRPDVKTGWECYWVGFSGLENRDLSETDQIVRIGFDEEIVGLFRKMLDVVNCEKPGYQQLLSGILIHLIAHLLFRKQDNSWKDKDVLKKINKARLIIREKINTPVSPEEIAASLNMSYTWFRRMFKNYTGLAPAQYITQLKIQKARELLSVTTMPIKEIALELGYQSIDYFSTAFKRETGISPAKFRNPGK